MRGGRRVDGEPAGGASDTRAQRQSTYVKSWLPLRPCVTSFSNFLTGAVSRHTKSPAASMIFFSATTLNTIGPAAARPTGKGFLNLYCTSTYPCTDRKHARERAINEKLWRGPRGKGGPRLYLSECLWYISTFKCLVVEIPKTPILNVSATKAPSTTS